MSVEDQEALLRYGSVVGRWMDGQMERSMMRMSVLIVMCPDRDENKSIYPREFQLFEIMAIIDSAFC